MSDFEREAWERLEQPKIQDGGPPKRREHLHVKSDAKHGGIAYGGEDAELVVCDLDMQPHYEDAHALDNKGRNKPCIDPLKWTRHGVKMEEMDL